MDFFPADPGTNLLPHDGLVHYHPSFIPSSETDRYLRELTDEIPWKHDEVTMFGKTIITARKVAWFGNPGLDYAYSGKTKSPLPWSELLLELKMMTEEKTGHLFNSCLLNLYHDGSEGMSWHRDNESSIVRDSPITCLSFGAERRFHFKHVTTKERITLELAPGSLLLMAGETQTHWLHALPKTTRVSEPRISLTFRQMKESWI
jgi:alkylated DNA repair dioxygenase AlkB